MCTCGSSEAGHNLLVAHRVAPITVRQVDTAGVTLQAHIRLAEDSAADLSDLAQDLPTNDEGHRLRRIEHPPEYNLRAHSAPHL